MERKVHTVAFTGVLPTNVQVPTFINNIAQGPSNLQRIGDVMTVTNIMLRFTCKATATSTAQSYRVMLIWDKQPNKAIATLADIFTGGAPHSTLDFLELDGRKRFQTVFNSGIFMVGANTNDNDNRVFEFYCKAKAETIWTGDGGTIGFLTTGALLLVTIGSNGTAANVCSMDFQLRLRFVDGSSKGNPRFWNKRTVGNLQSG